jgi:hypothetical protein
LKKIIVLPTAQVHRSCPWQPNEHGKLRAKAALQALLQHEHAELIICGGLPNHRGYSLASCLLLALMELADEQKVLTECKDRVSMIFGKENRTIDDITQGMLHFLSFRQQRDDQDTLYPCDTHLYFCSEQPHYDRIRATIAVLGFHPIHIESGADHSIYGPADQHMAEETDLGKILGLGESANHWRFQANLRVKAHSALCQTWADRNPALDREYTSRVRQLLIEMHQSGCLVCDPALPQLNPALSLPRLLKPA